MGLVSETLGFSASGTRLPRMSAAHEQNRALRPSARFCVAGGRARQCRDGFDTGRAGCAREGRSSRGSTLDARRLGARDGSAGSRRVARGAGANARPGARADPVRADAPLAACLLPRRGRDHGGRPRACAANRAGRSALGRCASLQLRRLRSLGPASRLQPERLRRDAARAVRVGRQAPGREPRGGRAGARVRQEAAAGSESHGRPLVPPGAAGLRPEPHARRLVRTARSRRDRAAVDDGGAREAPRPGQAQPRQADGERQPPRARQADRGRRGQAAHRQRPALDRPARGARVGRGERAVGRDAPRDLHVVPAHAHGRPPAAPGPFPLHPGRAQGRRGRQRGHADVDRPAARP